MKLYLAAVYTSNFNKSSSIYQKLTPAEKYHRDNHPWILESYHYIHKESYVEKLRQDGLRVFLDSGAFSAFTKGVQIDIPTYCEYVKRNHNIIEEVEVEFNGYRGKVQLFSVLDCIGDKERGAGTLRNQEAMEKLGVFPLPCFHYGEDEKYLEYYISRYPYITLGGMVPITTKQLYYWLDRIWDRYLTKSDGSPKLKVHGFGLTTVDLMERYPWYSVDSSSWVQIAVHGNILIPDNPTMRRGVPKNEFISQEKDWNIAISKDSPRLKEQNFHYDNVTPAAQERIREFIEQQGFEVARLRDSAYTRWAWNFFAYHQINERTNRANKTFKPEQRGLF